MGRGSVILADFPSFWLKGMKIISQTQLLSVIVIPFLNSKTCKYCSSILVSFIKQTLQFIDYLSHGMMERKRQALDESSLYPSQFVFFLPFFHVWNQLRLTQFKTKAPRLCNAVVVTVLLCCYSLFTLVTTMVYTALRKRPAKGIAFYCTARTVGCFNSHIGYRIGSYLFLRYILLIAGWIQTQT